MNKKTYNPTGKAMLDGGKRVSYSENVAKEKWINPQHVHECVKVTCPNFRDDLVVKGVAIKGCSYTKIHEDVFILYQDPESAEWYRAKYTFAFDTTFVQSRKPLIKASGSKSTICGWLEKLNANAKPIKSFHPSDDFPKYEGEHVKFYPYHTRRTGLEGENDSKQFLKRIEGLTAAKFHQIMWPTTQEVDPCDRKCFSYSLFNTPRKVKGFFKDLATFCQNSSKRTEKEGKSERKRLERLKKWKPRGNCRTFAGHVAWILGVNLKAIRNIGYEGEIGRYSTKERHRECASDLFELPRQQLTTRGNYNRMFRPKSNDWGESLPSPPAPVGFAPWMKVRLKGLAIEKFNGRIGRIQKRHEDSDRWVVELLDGKREILGLLEKSFEPLEGSVYAGDVSPRPAHEHSITPLSSPPPLGLPLRESW